MDIPAAMEMALDLARESPDTRPNPKVGCVILDEAGEIVGRGRHEGPGLPHAEAAALAEAGVKARGGTAVVTLEPCNHQGRTGPCAQALIDAGVRAVVFAQPDPNRIAAGGAKALRAAGIRVSSGIKEADAGQINPMWTFAMEQGRPLVRWKTASTLDGRVAAVDGSSRWITGKEAREDVHHLRADCDAVLIGTGTMFTDDPELTARVPSARQPLRVVMGQRSVPADARIRRADPMNNFVSIPTRNPASALADLLRRDVHSVLLEGGPTLVRSFLKAGLIDAITWYVAPALLGAGREVIGSLGVTSIDGANRFVIESVRQVGNDVRMDLNPPPASGRS